MKKENVAILYDFDQTLSKKDQQEYTFIPSLGLTAPEFWGMADVLSKKYNMDRILAYMLLMISEAKKKNIPVTRKSLNALGKDVELLPGLDTWFTRINEFGKAHNLKIEHYIISSGVKEIMDGTSIAKNFKKIFGCEFHYDDEGNAFWPAQVINYTSKTQYVFRISKGAFELYDDSKVNANVGHDNRNVLYTNMIYLGDGMTDVPCMKLVREKGGYAIALYRKNTKAKMEKLLKDDRIDFACLANYSAGSDLEQSIQKLIEKMSIEAELRQKYTQQMKNIKKKEEVTN